MLTGSEPVSAANLKAALGAGKDNGGTFVSSGSSGSGGFNKFEKSTIAGGFMLAGDGFSVVCDASGFYRLTGEWTVKLIHSGDYACRCYMDAKIIAGDSTSTVVDNAYLAASRNEETSKTAAIDAVFYIKKGQAVKMEYIVRDKSSGGYIRSNANLTIQTNRSK